MWYTAGNEPPPFAEEASHARLFDRRVERGIDWEVAFYRSLTRADGIVLIGGANATNISGQVAIGTRMAILALKEFGGAAAKVWESLSAGIDLPTRDEIDLMARPWTDRSAAACVEALFAQRARRAYAGGAPPSASLVLGGVMFLGALAIVAAVWGHNALAAWMLFMAPLLAGVAGASVRPLVDRQRGTSAAPSTLLATVVVGLIAGGMAGVLFVTAQLTGNPQLADASELVQYAERSIPYAVGVGFVAGLTSDAVFGKLLALDVARTTGVSSDPTRV